MTVMIIGVIILIAVNIIVLSVVSNRYHNVVPGGIGVVLVAPFQEAVTRSIRFVRDIWTQYFCLISVAKENDKLKKELSSAIEKNSQLSEIELSNLRFRNLLNFQKTMTGRTLAAELISKDPSPWYKTAIIDKGKTDGIKKGFPVVTPEGIVGQVVDVFSHYSKVLLIVDRNSAVDALAQRTRARGIVKGESMGQCYAKYVLRKHDIKIGDTIVSSGLDGVFPKGLRIGRVSGVIRRNSGIFQEVTVTPYVDFEKFEEVLVILNPPENEFVRTP